MNSLGIFVKKLDQIIALERSSSLETLGSYIVGELLGDHENRYSELNETNPIVQRIGVLASDLEISNGNEVQLKAMWIEIKQLANELRLSL